MIPKCLCKFNLKPEQCEVRVYGSAINGLLETESSDLDLTLLIWPEEDCTDPIAFLKDLPHEKILKAIKPSVKGNEVYPMSAGFLLDFTIDKIDVSLSVNKTLEIFNSELLYTYC